jgi:hypothetical protein
LETIDNTPEDKIKKIFYDAKTMLSDLEGEENDNKA